VRVQFSNILLHAQEGVKGKSQQDATLLPGDYWCNRFFLK